MLAFASYFEIRCMSSSGIYCSSVLQKIVLCICLSILVFVVLRLPDDLPSFPMNESLLWAAKERVTLARKIELQEYR